MKKMLILSLVLVSLLVLAACTPEAEEVEVTRVVTETVMEEVEVTRIVEGETQTVTEIQEVEVTRVVESVVEVPSDEQRTLVFSSRLFSPAREQEYFTNEIIKPFEEEHNVKVIFQILDDDTLLDRAQIQQETNHITTDIVAAHNGKMPDWLDADYVEDLTDLVASWTDRTFVEAFESDTNRDG